MDYAWGKAVPVHTAHGLCLRQDCPCSHSSWTVLEARLSLFTQLMDGAWGKAVPVHKAHGLCAWGKAVPAHTAPVLETRLSPFTQFLCLRQGCPCSHSSCAWDKAVPFDTAPVLETRLLFSYLAPTSVGGLGLSLQWVSNRFSSAQHNPISANGIMILSPAVCTLTWTAWPSPSTGLSDSVVWIGEVSRVCRPHDRCSLRVQWHLAGIIWGPKIQLYLTESASWTSLCVGGWGGGEGECYCMVRVVLVCVWSMIVCACMHLTWFLASPVTIVPALKTEFQDFNKSQICILTQASSKPHVFFSD